MTLLPSCHPVSPGDLGVPNGKCEFGHPVWYLFSGGHGWLLVTPFTSFWIWVVKLERPISRARLKDKREKVRRQIFEWSRGFLFENVATFRLLRENEFIYCFQWHWKEMCRTYIFLDHHLILVKDVYILPTLRGRSYVVTQLFCRGTNIRNSKFECRNQTLLLPDNIVITLLSRLYTQ